ncbi:UNVERIFIED_CONTAM: hypothetical protein HDU68_010164 [Siphonaria sp. JEL0065]|nr:hypothetical protein HDU68_010164 [Siphonaria sp. JEL0065]
MTKSEQVLFTEPINALDITAKDSGFPVQFKVSKRSDTKTTQITYEIPDSAQEDSAVTITLSPKGTLSIDVYSKKKRGFFGLFKLGELGNKKIKINIELPSNDLVSVSHVAALGEFEWDGPNVSRDFSIVSELGCASLLSPIHVETFNVALSKGEFKATSVIANSVAVKVEMGELKGFYSGYKNLYLHASMGAVKVDLKPGVASETKIEASMGEVVATVSGYEGKFLAEASMGGVTVIAPGVMQTSNPCSGVVGDNQDSTLNVKVSMGGCKLNFVE